MSFAILEPRSDFDKCILGMGVRGSERVLVYSVSRIIEMMLSGGTDYDDVVEYLEYNTFPAQTEGWPIFLMDENPFGHEELEEEIAAAEELSVS